MSTTLYIVGNGFDLANELQTSYNCFREHLLKKYGKETKELVGHFVVQRRGKLAPNDSQNVMLMVKMIDSALSRVYHKKQEWKYFEDVLGRLKYEDLWNDKSENELNGILVHISFTRLRDYFKEWIMGIDLKKAKPISGSPQNNDALFLSFNYTLTLENIYQVSPIDVCHVHGVCGDKELIFGHIDLTEKIRNESAAKRQIAIVREILVKDTKKCYSEQHEFFDRIDRNIKEIVSIGFSYADVDMYYMEKIIKKVGDDTIWYLHMYKLIDTFRYVYKIRKCGFRGKIRIFKNIGNFKSIY